MSTRSRGVTLMELIVFIVIVGVALAGVFGAFNTMTRGSADPQVRKQVLAIAESLMEEIMLMPFTYCDPDDPAASTATGTGSCTRIETIGLDTAFAPYQTSDETRYSTTARFDNVNDYHDFKMGIAHGSAGIYSISDGTTKIPGLDDYSVIVSIVDGSAALSLGAGEALRVTVTASHTSGVSISLDGYRARYAPTTLP
jgi:MSHA pilin protein MshD